MKEIQSNEEINIEQCFKISAGPGAGKTHWMVEHVKNVLRKSKRLAKTAKIACITYTNTGVEEIQRRLKSSAERIDVSTIHSFLYRNVLTPYAFLLKDDCGRYLINLYELDGHDEHIPSPDIIFQWKSHTGQQYLKEDEKIYMCLQDLDWQFNAQGELTLYPRQSWKLKLGQYSIRKNSFIEYKKLYWNRGQLHHEDVLYFAHRLISEHPEILSFISAKYPYIFIDEFQDTHPIQTVIIKRISEQKTVVGVIGDPAQSIYRFQGAERQDFIDFSLPDIQRYYIKGNRRSTSEIIDLLNKMRGDEIQQQCIRNVRGDKITFLVGDIFKAVNFVAREVGYTTILARNNEIVGKIKQHNDRNLGDLWTLSRLMDSNRERQELIYNTIYAVELVFSSNYQDARKKLSKLFRVYSDRTKIPKNRCRECAVALLQKLINQHQDSLQQSISDYNNCLYNFIKDNFDVKIGAKVTSGPYKNKFADNYTCKDLCQTLRVKDDDSRIRTIHKAKSAEFDNVLVIVENEAELKHITKPIINSADDDSRIYYVALSRAKNHLYITLPTFVLVQREMEKLAIKIRWVNWAIFLVDL